VLANIMVGTFMVVLDSTIVNVSLPKIMSSFGVGLSTIQWVITAYMLSMAAMLPTSGWLADKFGYKKVYFWGLFLFTLGSLLCGLSNDENTLIISRIIQGLGAGNGTTSWYGYYHPRISCLNNEVWHWDSGQLQQLHRFHLVL
jgi:DHA2 family multidrug resistance protein